jgi:hypothetical protein
MIHPGTKTSSNSTAYVITTTKPQTKGNLSTAIVLQLRIPKEAEERKTNAVCFTKACHNTLHKETWIAKWPLSVTTRSCSSGSSSPLCFMQIRVGGSVKTQLS